MTICEICGGKTKRRIRLNDGRLVCWQCNQIQKNSYEENCKTVKNYRDYAKQGWNKVTELRKEKSISLIPPEYKYTNPISAVPPVDVLERSLLALDMMNYFSNFSEVLADYYGFEAPRYLISDEKCSPDANATYYWRENNVYTRRDRPLKNRTAFHEIWHALERHGIVPNTKDSEKNAELYAKACLRRLNKNENS